MLDPEFLKILRCPIAPKSDAPLTQTEETKLACSRCPVHFPIRDGFPILLVDEAVLPADCASVEQLPLPTNPNANVSPALPT